MKVIIPDVRHCLTEALIEYRTHRAFTIGITAFALPILLFILLPIILFLTEAPPRDVIAAATEREVLASLSITFRSALWATLTATLFGIPLAYFLSRFSFPGKSVIEGIVELPVVIPHSAAGIALLSAFGSRSLFGTTTHISIVGNEIGIAVAMFFVSVPFLINALKEGFNLIDERYEKVALTLGASPLRALLTVTLPMAKHSLFSGMILMWGRGISEFGAVMILAYHPMTAPVLIYDRFESFGLTYARPVTALLIIITLIIFTLFKYVTRRRP